MMSIMFSARSLRRSPRSAVMSRITCSPMPSITCVLASTSRVKREESSPIDWEISLTSLAITAKPDPTSPAWALSISALMASMRVREMKADTSRACADAVAERSKARGTMRCGITASIPPDPTFRQVGRSVYPLMHPSRPCLAGEAA